MSNITFILYSLLSLTIAALPLLFKKLKSEKWVSLFFDNISFIFLSYAIFQNFIDQANKLTPYFAFSSFLVFFCWLNLVIKISLIRNLFISKKTILIIICVLVTLIGLALFFQEDIGKFNI